MEWQVQVSTHHLLRAGSPRFRPTQGAPWYHITIPSEETPRFVPLGPSWRAAGEQDEDEWKTLLSSLTPACLLLPTIGNKVATIFPAFPGP
jgi:hypothetical protein